jgi:hypothetical protein
MPNPNGTGLFGGFMNPMTRKLMQQRRKTLGMSNALQPQRPNIPMGLKEMQGMRQGISALMRRS